VGEKLKNPEISDTVKDTQNQDPTIFNIHQKPVMLEVVDVLSLLGKLKKATLRAKGESIPNAVAVANIITEKMLKGHSNIQKISVDTEGAAGIGKMLSTIEIILTKN
jgi:archaea-specific DNA-binding protein